MIENYAQSRNDASVERVLGLSIRKICLLSLMLLAGCQSVPKPSIESSDEWVQADGRFATRTKVSESLIHWRYSAKASIKSQGKTDQFNLDWRFAEGAHSIRIFGPLGVGAVRLDYDGGEARLSDNDGVKYTGPDAASLLREITGLNLPINALQYWLFAVPAPDALAHYQLNLPEPPQLITQEHVDVSPDSGAGSVQAQGLRNSSNQSSNFEIGRLKQLGWESSFSDYRLWQERPNGEEGGQNDTLQANAKSFRFPRRISSQGRGSRGEQIQVKIITKLWDFDAPESDE